MNEWKAIFYFTKSERIGILVLTCCICLVFMLPHHWRVMQLDKPIETEFLLEEVEQFFLAQQRDGKPAIPDSLFFFDPNTATPEAFAKLGLSERTIQTVLKYRNKVGSFNAPDEFSKVYTLSDSLFRRLKPYIKINVRPKIQSMPKSVNRDKRMVNLFPFDPNTVDSIGLLQLGIPDRIVRTWLNYRKSGGSFKKKEDLKKIYGLSDQLFVRLDPYIKFNTTNQSSIQKIKHLDINQATREEWMALRGIGPAYSNRIVAFRTKLGGFSSVDQVGETYYLPDSTFQSIKPFLVVSPILKKLEVNHLKETELSVHPYISSKMARVIVAYRQQHGVFTNFEDFKKIKILTEKDQQRIKAYLSFE